MHDNVKIFTYTSIGTGDSWSQRTLDNKVKFENKFYANKITSNSELVDDSKNIDFEMLSRLALGDQRQVQIINLEEVKKSKTKELLQFQKSKESHKENYEKNKSYLEKAKKRLDLTKAHIANKEKNFEKNFTQYFKPCDLLNLIDDFKKNKNKPESGTYLGNFGGRSESFRVFIDDKKRASLYFYDTYITDHDITKKDQDPEFAFKIPCSELKKEDYKEIIAEKVNEYFKETIAHAENNVESAEREVLIDEDFIKSDKDLELQKEISKIDQQIKAWEYCCKVLSPSDFKKLEENMQAKVDSGRIKNFEITNDGIVEMMNAWRAENEKENTETLSFRKITDSVFNKVKNLIKTNKEVQEEEKKYNKELVEKLVSIERNVRKMSEQPEVLQNVTPQIIADNKHIYENVDTALSAMIIKMQENGMQITKDSLKYKDSTTCEGRCKCENESGSKTAGWYKIHLDESPNNVPNLMFCNYKHGDTEQKFSFPTVNSVQNLQNKKVISNNAVKKLENTYAPKIEKQNQENTAKREKISQILTSELHSSTPCSEWDSKYLQQKDCKPTKGVYVKLTEKHKYMCIPYQDINGKITTKQSIDENGTKYWFKDGQKQGSFHVIDGFEKLANKESAGIILAEGYATANTINEATNGIFAVVSVGDCGNIENVAKAMREKFPDKKIAIACDNDRLHPEQENVGLKHATNACKAINAELIIPKFKQNKTGTDFNDLKALEGIETVKEIFREYYKKCIMPEKQMNIAKKHEENNQHVRGR